MLAHLKVHQLRNLRAAQLGPLACHNVIFGSNGSGKTSLLEAVHILGTARSFRSGSTKSLITHGEERYAVFGERELVGGGRRALGVQRDRGGEVQLRVGGEALRSVARLADELPLLLIDADSFDLLVGEPANRRRFLDWGVFHVEHENREHRQRFQRALAQRNHLLRRDRIEAAELDVWTRDLALHGEAVSAARSRFLAALQIEFDALSAALVPEVGAVQLSYRCGWNASQSYIDALERSLTSDKEQKYTQSGPQRADIRVTVEGYPAAETLSRGQQKLVVCALKLAQGRLLTRQSGEVLFLIDDLPSELDQARCRRVCEALGSMPVQTLITCVDANAIDTEWLGGALQVAVFHVKHGEVHAVAGQR